jgi:CHAD domain
VTFVLGPYEMPGHGIERAIREQAEKLISECESAPQDTGAFAHKARVRGKKIRAAFRLAKPLMGAKTWREQNRWWRDAGRKLASLRDMGAGIAAIEALSPLLSSRVGTAMVWRLKERFAGQLTMEAASNAVDGFRAFISARKAELVPDLPPGERDDMIAALAESYRAARRAMKAGLKHNDPLLLHEWRKQLKSHSLQVRLLRTMFHDVLSDRVGATRQLTESLGEVQDIEVVLAGAKDWAEAPEALGEALNSRRNELIATAAAAGALLFADKPKAWRRILAHREVVR